MYVLIFEEEKLDGPTPVLTVERSDVKYAPT
jgi:hypothetical protein